jgi:hypothetical protein
MNKTISQLLNKRCWIAHIDDERELDNSIIVTLAKGWDFSDEAGCGVRGFDSIAELRSGTAKSSVVKTMVL